jgi:hypothetical protein
MKKSILLFGILACTTFSFSQDKDPLAGINEVIFYGIDYSNVKIYGADELPSEFKTAFERINQLLISEPKKYDISRYIARPVEEVSIKAVNKRLKELDLDAMFTTKKSISLSKEDLQTMVSALEIGEEEGIGVVFIAAYLDKADATGKYHIVFFDIATRDLIHSWEDSGEAGGFGLRNYWAGSIHRMIKYY